LIATKSETVAEMMAAELAAAGVDRVFGLPGGEVLWLIDALRRQGVEFVLCRHEADAGLMAAVYGKLKRVPGVVLTTLGPGACNLLLPIGNSILDREPLLAISAQVPDTWSAARIHQRLPLREIFAPVTKFNASVNAFNCRRVVRDSLRAALTDPAGPAYLAISSEVTRAQATPSEDDPIAALTTRPNVGDPEAAAAAVRERLAQAERPILAVGVGAHAEDAGLIRRWVDEWRLPVVVTPKVKGIVDEMGPLFAGVISGMAIDRVMVDGLGRSDLILGLGLDPTEIDGDWHERLRVLWLLDSAWATGVCPADDLVASAHTPLLERLLAEVAPREWDDPLAETRAERQRAYESGERRDGHLSPCAVVRTLAEVLPANTIVTTDVGSHKYLFGQFWPSREPETFFMSNGLSGMGYGLPAAIGAKLARPEQPVLAALGDGGFSMNSQELETARRVGAPILAVVLADRSYSMIRIGQRKRGLAPYGVDFDPIDSIAVARSCGVAGWRASSEAELAEHAVEALKSGETSVIEVPVLADDYAPIV
jgi:acetolactate synthase I/II/III large subunit